MLDGVIAAFHTHPGEENDEATRRLADDPNEDIGAVHGHLTDPGRGVLGERTLIWPFRSGLQWNPADDRLVAIHFEATEASHHRFSDRCTK